MIEKTLTIKVIVTEGSDASNQSEYALIHAAQCDHCLSEARDFARDMVGACFQTCIGNG